MVNVTTTGELAKHSGIKAIIYGAAGCGKTPLVTTAPNPLYIAIEQGQVSLQGTDVPAVAAHTLPEFYAVMKWLDESAEAKKFDTLYFDSASHFAALVLQDELSKTSASGAKVNGQAAYGDMAKRVLKLMNKVYSMPDKNVIMLAQLNDKDPQHKPFFDGNEINIKLRHLFDGVWHLGMHDLPEKGVKYSLQCRETPEIFARCRFNNCDDFERPNLTYLFNKLNQTPKDGVK
jgi:hypothetical protein